MENMENNYQQPNTGQGPYMPGGMAQSNPQAGPQQDAPIQLLPIMVPNYVNPNVDESQLKMKRFDFKITDPTNQNIYAVNTWLYNQSIIIRGIYVNAAMNPNSFPPEPNVRTIVIEYFDSENHPVYQLESFKGMSLMDSPVPKVENAQANWIRNYPNFRILFSNNYDVHMDLGYCTMKIVVFSMREVISAK